MPQRDTLAGTFTVAAVLCVVCSLAVSAAAVALRPLQEKNKVLDRQKNILDAAGLAMGEYGKPASELSGDQIEELYGWVSEKLVVLETGEYDSRDNPEKYDPREAAKKPDDSIAIVDPEFDIGEARREKVSRVYFVIKPGNDAIQQVVLPVYGKGLWSTLYGYLALKADLKTIQGLTFYEHAETPGLGGEVDNTRWKAQWVGNKLFDPEGKPAAMVAKGPAPDGSDYAVDGLSGATITCRGVTNLVRYWAGPNGYGPFLERLKDEISSTVTASNASDQDTSKQVSGRRPRGDAHSSSVEA
ncbi:MAG: Na(+)-translocating NADH-quinone reductase subunit C [Planctomycetota bacterium]